MRLIKYALLGLLMIAIIVISLANRGPVTLNLLPEGIDHIFPLTQEVPLFAVILVSILTGMLLGYFLEYLREHKFRRSGNQQKRETKRLQREIQALKKKHVSEADEVLAILDNASSNA